MPTPYQVCYHLKAQDTEVVRQVLGLLEDQTNRLAIAAYDILNGTTIEDVFFLDLMSKNETLDDSEKLSESFISPRLEGKSAMMDFPTGRPVSPFQQAFTIFYKRTLILKRSWLTPLLTVIIAFAAATIPLVFFSGQPETCAVRFRNCTSIPLYLPSSPPVPPTLGSSFDVVISPPNITTTLNNTKFFQTTNVPNNATFVNYISQNYCNLSLGGVSLDPNTGASFDSLGRYTTWFYRIAHAEPGDEPSLHLRSECVGKFSPSDTQKLCNFPCSGHEYSYLLKLGHLLRGCDG